MNFLIMVGIIVVSLCDGASAMNTSRVPARERKASRFSVTPRIARSCTQISKEQLPVQKYLAYLQGELTYFCRCYDARYQCDDVLWSEWQLFLW